MFACLIILFLVLSFYGLTSQFKPNLSKQWRKSMFRNRTRYDLHGTGAHGCHLVFSRIDPYRCMCAYLQYMFEPNNHLYNSLSAWKQLLHFRWWYIVLNEPSRFIVCLFVFCSFIILLKLKLITKFICLFDCFVLMEMFLFLLFFFLFDCTMRIVSLHHHRCVSVQTKVCSLIFI